LGLTPKKKDFPELVLNSTTKSGLPG